MARVESTAFGALLAHLLSAHQAPGVLGWVYELLVWQQVVSLLLG